MNLYVGVVGWSYHDWEGVVYPRPKPKGFDPLNYAASYPDAIIINNGFNKLPLKKDSESWVRRIERSARFKFTLRFLRNLHTRMYILVEER